MNALFIVYLIGLIIATFQDFKRREIDNWLNLFLFFAGFGYIILNVHLLDNYYSFFTGILFLGLVIFFGFLFFPHSETNSSFNKDKYLLSLYSKFKFIGKRSDKKDKIFSYIKDFVCDFFIPSCILFFIFYLLFLCFGFATAPVFIILAYFLLVCAFSSLLFYQARVFSGGDTKLLFALSPLFFSLVFIESIINFGMFIFLLFFSGSVYSIFFILFFIFKDFKKLKPVFIKNIRKFKIYFGIIILISILGFLYREVFYFALFFIFILLLYIVSLSLEGVSLTKKVLAKDLMEGDWIAKKFKFMGRNFDYSWEGLSEKDIKFLKNYDKYIEVKDGIPYALSFLIALILFYFKDLILEIL